MSSIKLDTHELKVMVFGAWVMEKNSGEVIKKLESSGVKNLPKPRTIQKWFTEFKREKFQFKRKLGAGRPIAVTTESNVKKIKEKVDEDRSVTVKKLSRITGMKQGSIKKIIVKKLQGTKLKPILNPHLLTDQMKKERYDWCWRMLLRIAVDPGILDQIVTGDETYLFFE